MKVLKSHFLLVFTLIKSFVGTGIIFLPGTFRVSGILCGNLLSGIVCILAILSLRLLIKCCDESENLSDLGKKIWGKTGLLLIDSSIFFSQLGFSTIYMIFIAHSVQQIIYSVSNCQIEISILKLICMQMIIYLPFVFLRDIGNLSFPNILANISVFSVLGVIIYYSSENILKNSIGRPNILDKGNIYGAGLVLGTSAFNFEGIALILPIRNSTPKLILNRFPSIMTFTMVFIGLFSNFFATLVYYSFGEDTSSPVTENILNPRIKLISLILYSIAITFSVPLQLYPSMKIAERYLFSNSINSKAQIEDGLGKRVLVLDEEVKHKNNKYFSNDLIYSQVSSTENNRSNIGFNTNSSNKLLKSSTLPGNNKKTKDQNILNCNLSSNNENFNERNFSKSETKLSLNRESRNECIDNENKIGNVEMILMDSCNIDNYNNNSDLNNQTVNNIQEVTQELGFKKSFLRAVLAYSLVLFCGTMAYCFEEELSNFVTITGGLLCVPLAFVYPPMFYYKLNKNRISLTERIFLSFLVLIGSFVSITSVTMAVLTWETSTRTVACVI
ncbi:ABC transporter [Cryptosporidium ryanae]|uniref:ABC transporter n=1 Tax=Cryptosporidium ryanae TaxID=515981 RepID=UPI00351A753A|nr:ABC transporter [Cryptosporidium ryanae]